MADEAAPKRNKTAGRKPGVRNIATRVCEQKLAEALIAERLTAEQDCAGAKITANMIAPYENARLSSSDVRITDTNETESDTQIEAELAEVRAKLAAARVPLN